VRHLFRGQLSDVAVQPPSRRRNIWYAVPTVELGRRGIGEKAGARLFWGLAGSARSDAMHMGEQGGA
jgi:hypothetical protein